MAELTPERSKRSGVLRATVAATATAPVAMKDAARPLKVLLIQPPVTDGVESLLPQVDNEGGEGIGYKPPLGVLYVATTLAARSPHEVRVIDALAEQRSVEDLADIAEEFQPDVVGISAWTDFWYPAWHTGAAISERVPGAHICYGGPHVGIYAEETLAQPFVDSVVVGDGEVPFLYLCNMLSNGVSDNSLPGLHMKEHGVKLGPDMYYVEGDLDGLPHPDRTLLPVENYSSVLGHGAYVTTMITSRGCPFRCTFCKLNFQKNLARSASNVVDEFRRISELGIREVEIYDDTFTWSRKRLVEICEGLVQADLGIEWAIRDRVSAASIDDETLDLMYRAGCRRIHYGIESGAQHVLERMKKKITLEQAEQAIAMAKRAGMTVLAYFMFGNLDETADDMRETIEFAIRLDPHYAQFSITIPYAGTEMYEEGLKEGHLSYDFWGEYARSPVPSFHPPEVIEYGADLETLLALRDEAIRRFYFRFRFLARSIVTLRSIPEFTRKLRMGVQLARTVFTPRREGSWSAS